MFWYCLPDSRLLHAFNPETSSWVTLAPLGTVFQTGLTYSGDSLPLHRLGFLQPLFFQESECHSKYIVAGCENLFRSDIDAVYSYNPYIING